MSEASPQPVDPERPPLIKRFVGKLTIALLFFVLLTSFGGFCIRTDAFDAHEKKWAGTKVGFQLNAWKTGIIANLFGCLSSFFIVYLLRSVRFAPMFELAGAMLCRLGIPVAFCLLHLPRAGLTESQEVYREWALFYIVLIYLVTLPLDVWLVLPGKSGRVNK